MARTRTRRQGSQAIPRRRMVSGVKAITKKRSPELEEKLGKYPAIKQSLELMKILIHVTVNDPSLLRTSSLIGGHILIFHPSITCQSSQFGGRDLIPSCSIGKRKLPSLKIPRQRALTYDEFVNGKHKKPLKDYSKCIWVMERGQDVMVDRLLDLLVGPMSSTCHGVSNINSYSHEQEEGIFDALVRQRVAAIQITLLEDLQMPQNVIESYTITIEHCGDHGPATPKRKGRAERTGRDQAAPTQPKIDVGRSLKALERRLATVTMSLPALPSSRNVGLHMLYNNNCPKGYTSLGFQAATPSDKTLLYYSHNNFQRLVQSFGMVDCGYHRAGLQVNCLRRCRPRPQAPPEIELELKKQRKHHRRRPLKLDRSASWIEPVELPSPRLYTEAIQMFADEGVFPNDPNERKLPDYFSSQDSSDTDFDPASIIRNTDPSRDPGPRRTYEPTSETSDAETSEASEKSAEDHSPIILNRRYSKGEPSNQYSSL
ncbi:DNA-binding HORMA [Penicillium hispanicum]|uniref:DNA-binding HORMA n=1 Tax=Penicillium hispanicum TaxID=1080232 RepID=UPI002541F352|nr:DNA-binding HORMA [Penicillium hispanicum]KAJ5570596.1 DNA-binding HORMA [Penicillium hispanicum]